MMLAETYPHIGITPEGVPILSDTPIKVVEIALDYLAHHWTADEIQRQHPHLSLGQIHSALAYYFDHQNEIDRVIDEQLRQVANIRARVESPTIRDKLKALGLLS
jgi:uncharacterized protein (DUF433 family)